MLGKVRGAVAAVMLAVGASAQADVGIVEKKSVSMERYTTVSGRTLRNVEVGYETYGKLNAAGDNAIFVAHFLTGTSHAAGRYRSADRTPGYWDAIIGSGRAIDTDRYFVISADALANVNKPPAAIATGPASIDPDTGKPYGASFPVITARDSVNVHKALVDSLGVKRLHAVVGASGGSMQAMEWAAAFPEFVPRVIHVIGPGLDVHPYAIGLLDVWSMPVRHDPRWAGGNYYGKEEPSDGVAQALKAMTLAALHFGWAEKVHGYRWGVDGRNPLDALGNRFAVNAWLDTSSQAGAGGLDAGALVWSTKAYQLYNLDKDAERIRARVLFLPATTDMIFPPELSRRAAERLRRQGNHVELFEIEGPNGHLDGIFSIGKAADTIRAFLAR